VLPDNEVAETLQLMTRPANAKLTPEVARELCQRTDSKAYIAGSIASLGSQYVLGLKAVNCQSGDPLAQEQATAASKEKVLDALGEVASKLRSQLGESLATVQKFDRPLADATTSSLPALKAYSLDQWERAIQLDPNFAMAYWGVGQYYLARGELGRAREYFTKAFQLRDHSSERERLGITAGYYREVTGELDKAIQTYQDVVTSYPREQYGYGSFGGVYAEEGQYEKAAEVTRQAVSVTPNWKGAYSDLANYAFALQRFDETRQIIHDAKARKLDDEISHNALYALAFLATDSAAMAEQQRWYASQPEYENFGLALASDTEAYAGHLGKARELTMRAVDSAIRANGKGNGAIWQAIAAQREAAFGNAAEARKLAEESLKLAPANSGAESEAALAFAMAGDAGRAESLAQDLGKRFPLDTQMQSLWLPTIRAQLALGEKNPTAALNTLQAALPIELGQIMFIINTSCLYHVYVRGQAYLAAGEGGSAAAEFQKILDHSGIVWNCWTGALAHLGVARANALQAGIGIGSHPAAQDAGKVGQPSDISPADRDAARVRALAAYKDFLTLWKDADADIPIYKQAKAEYATLH
jgi:eukaryotic-like serine/threonine-protein kinase